MALQTGYETEDWENYFLKAGISADLAKSYAATFVREKLRKESLQMMDRAMLRELGITTMGEALAILKQAKEPPTQNLCAKAPAVKPPQLHLEMTPQQFRKFRIDWDVFTTITDMPISQTNVQLYSCADEFVQNAIINTYPNFLTTDPDKLLEMTETLVTRRSNPMVNRMTFASLSQHEDESIQQYLVRLRSTATDCNFSCPHCDHDLSDIYIKDQFIKGVANETLQTDLLAKARLLKTLDQNICHAEAFESALRDQTVMNDTSDIATVRMSMYRRQKKNRAVRTNRGSIDTTSTATHNDNVAERKPHQTCIGCGSHQHGTPRTSARHLTCPAWNQTCNTCGKLNHFSIVCRAKKHHPAVIKGFEDEEAPMNTLMAHITFDQMRGTFMTADGNQLTEINALVTPFSPKPDPRRATNIPGSHSTTLKVFPDSGATICLGGPKHLINMGLTMNNLVPSKKIIRTVGGFTLMCQGWLPVEFVIRGRMTKQALYICKGIQRLYFSRAACIDVGILHRNFPNPSADKHNEVDPKSKKCEGQLPNRPKDPPYPATENNIGKLKNWLLEKFAKTAFNKDGIFPAMSGPAAHIHLKEGAVPKARHSPIPVPFHFKEPVRQALWNDVERGIIAPVPVGMPTDWCSTMVITAKKNGNPRRTIDYQHLNSQCKRETHHTGSPFQLALQVPPRTKKTVLDAVDGYHSIPLDKESQPLTTFITEWGRYMYLRMPQGYVASGDAYTRRYDEVIRDIPRKVKIVDDTLLYDYSIEEAFYHTFDFLLQCAKNGIVLNTDKFQFCQDVVQFGGLQITPTGVTPSESMIKAIHDFPVPRTITDARSWFGLVNQVAWAYSLSPVMLPFRDLVKQNSKFAWNQSLEDAFKDSKQVIIHLVKKGVATFDKDRLTCLAPDWSKEGMGFLLLQKHCQCTVEKAPVCCSEGWHLIYAGSRFCTDAERRYAPIEGEAAAIAWALEKCRMFVMGSPNIVVVTDHEPLKGLFSDRDLSKIQNPRLFRLKEKTLRYRFTIQHCPGKWHRGPDAVSRHPVAMVQALLDIFPAKPSQSDITESNNISDITESTALMATFTGNSNVAMISPDIIRAAGHSDPQYEKLIETIRQGFPKTRNLTAPEVREYWEVRHRLSTDNGLVLLDRRIVIPKTQRKKILHCLHSAHQGVVGMKARANESVYWPGMDASIRSIRANCMTCSTIAPSQPRETIILTRSPDWPFQQIVMDIFYVGDRTYLACADRLTGWLILYRLESGHTTTTKLMSICRQLFQTYGAPEELSTDGGPPFTSSTFQEFLRTWCVKHRLSSVAYPQSNGRAELAVKTAKRIVKGNTGPQGSLDNDNVARAILQYRNTPIQSIGLSPAQLLLHRRLRDSIPSQPILYKPHPEWVAAAQRREEMLHHRNAKIIERYNKHTHNLPPLQAGDTVTIQSPIHHRWNTTGKIINSLPDRQYRIRVNGSGRITLRNRRFLRKCEFKPAPTPIPSATLEPTTSPISAPLLHPPTPMEPQQQTTYTSPRLRSSRIPRALSRLFPHNKPGLKERYISHTTRPTYGGGEGRCRINK